MFVSQSIVSLNCKFNLPENVTQRLCLTTIKNLFSRVVKKSNFQKIALAINVPQHTWFQLFVKTLSSKSFTLWLKSLRCLCRVTYAFLQVCTTCPGCSIITYCNDSVVHWSDSCKNQTLAAPVFSYSTRHQSRPLCYLCGEIQVFLKSISIFASSGLPVSVSIKDASTVPPVVPWLLSNVS